MTDTLFKLPNSPEEFGVVLPPSSLRRIDFSALEFDTVRRAVIEYIKIYYPNEFNDFVANNGIMMLTEVISYISAINSVRMDVLANNFYLPTSDDRDAVQNHLELINRPIKRQTPAVVDIAVSVRSELPTTLSIGAGLQFSLTGPDGNTLFYELFRAPDDFISDIEIPPGKRGVIGYGVEGRFASDTVVISDGGPNQVINIIADDILDQPIIVEVRSGLTTSTWRRIDAIEKGIPTDEIYEVKFFDNRMNIVFGDDLTGKSPLAGQVITVKYRVGGGVRGRIGSGTIAETRSISPEPPASAPVEVSFRNLFPSNGGQNEETLDEAKRRAPREAATVFSATTAQDYAVLAADFNHPHFGSVLKSVATVRSSLNANLVEMYVLAEGPGGVPTIPSQGMKQGLVSFFDEINVITDEIRVLDGALKSVDLHMEVIISRSADASVVKDQVSSIVDDFFDVNNFEMGEAFHLSHLYEVVQKIDGVQFMSIITPKDSILPTNKIADSAVSGVGFNELIILGQKRIDFYFEKTR